MRCLVLLGLAASLLGLAGCSTVEPQWVSAADATYKAVAPEYVQYVRGDESLSSLQKEARLLLVQTWAARISSWKELEGER